MLLFLIKLTFCWSFFALLYAVLLRHETFFRANRAYLLGTFLLGIVLAAWPGEQIPVSIEDGGIPVVTPVFALGMQQVDVVATQWQNMDYIWVLYWVGFVATALRMFWGLLKLCIMIHKGRQERLADGTRLVHTADAQTPFSFFQWVFIPPATVELLDVSTTSILAHERAHVRAWHSVDVLLGEFGCVVFWFHPLAHWYKRALRALHEYQADAAAASLSNTKQYGLLLIGQSHSGVPIAFANHFFQSPLKQRLVMLTKKNSSPIRALQFGLVMPLALFLMLLFRQTPVMAQENTGKPASKSTDDQPSFPGGVSALTQYLGENIKYPESAKSANAEGMVVLRFVVQRDGSLSDIEEVKTKANNHPDLAVEAIRVVTSMPKWKPAVAEGKLVAKEFTLPIKFKLDHEPASALSEVDQAPEYPGGTDAMMQFLGKNIQYPEEARKAKVAGLVVIRFVVEMSGMLSSFETVSAPRPDLAEEAIRVLKLMPRFSPAMKDGKLVRVQYTLPVKFKLD